MTPRAYLAAALVLVVGGAVAAGLAVLGSPSEARARRLDERRVTDLIQTARDIGVYRTRRGALPESLAALAGESGLGLSATDPETGARYEYRATGAAEYELCAEFATATTDAPVGRTEARWVHAEGRQCFPIDAEQFDEADVPDARDPVSRPVTPRP